MRNCTPLIVALSCLATISYSVIHAESTESSKQPPAATTTPSSETSKAVEDNATLSTKPVATKAIEPFTGKITKNKVRLRLQPNFDGQVVRELSREQLIVIKGETEDFYVVQPMSDMRAYIFRTYVLDNVVEGTRVNVRLKPDLDAPVIAQLNSGDRVEGSIYGPNTKWLQINIPASTRFFVAKEYVEKVGDANYLARMDKRREEVNHLLNTTRAVSEAEMQKPFEQINLDGIIANYNRIILDYKDFPDSTSQAQALLKKLQESYVNKKVAYLEMHSQKSSNVLEQKNRQLAEELHAQKQKLSQLEQQMQREKALITGSQNELTSRRPTQLPYNMAAWIPIEDALFSAWSVQTGNDNPQAFYQEQKRQAFRIKGIVDPYNRLVKNKPGDYMLLSPGNKLPMSFLYSTQVNLQDYVGHEVALWVVSRPNFNYAFPAYFVLSVEE